MQPDQPDSGPIKLLTCDPVNRPRSSATLGKLAAALAKAQGEMTNASKDARGNFGAFANLASTWDAIRGPLSKNEIAIYQRPLRYGDKMVMATMLLHSSGEFLDDSELELIYDKSGGRVTPMQAMGSAITYARRYTLQAGAGIAPGDDDDGESAGRPKVQPSGQVPERRPQQPTSKQPPAAAQKPAQPPGGNHAPADQQLMDQITNLMIDRQIPESIVAYLLTKGYGWTQINNGNPPTWIAREVAKLLSNEDCTEATVMAEAQRIISRREAAKLTGGAK